MIDELPDWPEISDAPIPSGDFTESFEAAALDEIPEARAVIADVLAFWSLAEANLRVLLLGSFGSDIHAAHDLIAEARADRFIEKLLPAALSARDRPDMQRAVARFLSERETVKKHRSTFAHAIFARRSDLPGVLLVSRGDPFVKQHMKMFSGIARGDLSKINEISGFSAWSLDALQRVRRLTMAYMDATHTLSVCFARAPEEVGRWREELEHRGLSKAPPWA